MMCDLTELNATMREMLDEKDVKIETLRAEVERLRAALRRHIKLYRVDDDHPDREAEVDRILSLELEKLKEV